jgi:hypothetical protein
MLRSSKEYSMSVSTRRKKAGFLRVSFHLVLGLLTGGLWWIYLGLRYILSH